MRGASWSPNGLEIGKDALPETTRVDGVRTLTTHHDVSMLLLLKSSVSNNCTKYSTGLRISPRTFSSLRANTNAFLAASRSSPVANRWPNCESANSWTPPFAPTEK